MIKLNKKKTKAFAIRSWWSFYIYWLPTIMTEYHPKEDSVLDNFSIRDEFWGNGSNLGISILFLIWQIDIEFWWNITER
jgi:hypothetical protein